MQGDVDLLSISVVITPVWFFKHFFLTNALVYNERDDLKVFSKFAHAYSCEIQLFLLTFLFEKIWFLCVLCFDSIFNSNWAIMFTKTAHNYDNFQRIVSL